MNKLLIAIVSVTAIFTSAANAEYTMRIPLEKSQGGFLPDNTISFNSGKSPVDELYEKNRDACFSIEYPEYVNNVFVASVNFEALNICRADLKPMAAQCSLKRADVRSAIYQLTSLGFTEFSVNGVIVNESFTDEHICSLPSEPEPETDPTLIYEMSSVLDINSCPERRAEIDSVYGNCELRPSNYQIFNQSIAIKPHNFDIFQFSPRDEKGNGLWNDTTASIKRLIVNGKECIPYFVNFSTATCQATMITEADYGKLITIKAYSE